MNLKDQHSTSQDIHIQDDQRAGNKIPEIDDVYQRVGHSLSMVKANNITELAPLVDEIVKDVTLLFKHQPYITFIALNNQCKGHSIQTNFVVKSTILSLLTSTSLGYESSSSYTIASATFTISCLIAKQFTVIKKTPSLKIDLSKTIKSNFDIFKGLFSKQADTLRLISQIGGFNQFKNKSLLSQSIVTVSLAASFNAIPLKAMRNHTSLVALQTLRSQALPFLTRTNVASYLNEIVTAIDSLLPMGALVRTKGDSLGFILDRRQTLHSIDKWLLINCEDNGMIKPGEFEMVPADKLLTMNNQPVLSFTKLQERLVSLSSFDAYQKREKQISHLFDIDSQLTPSDSLSKLHRLLLTASTKQVSEYLDKDKLTAEFITDYASQLVRIKQPIKDMKHATALIGIARLAPVVAQSEVKTYQQHHRYLGCAEVFNKVNTLQDIGLLVARHLGQDIPEYFGHLNQLLMHSLMMIPRARYSASISKSVMKTTVVPNLGHSFSLSDTKQWRRLTLKQAQQWCLPTLYISILRDYFDYIEGQLDPRALPNISKNGLAVIAISHLIFERYMNGEIGPLVPESLGSFNKIIGYNASELSMLYDTVLNSVNPYSALS